MDTTQEKDPSNGEKESATSKFIARASQRTKLRESSFEEPKSVQLDRLSLSTPNNIQHDNDHVRQVFELQSPISPEFSPISLAIPPKEKPQDKAQKGSCNKSFILLNHDRSFVNEQARSLQKKQLYEASKQLIHSCKVVTPSSLSVRLNFNL